MEKLSKSIKKCQKKQICFNFIPEDHKKIKKDMPGR